MLAIANPQHMDIPKRLSDEFGAFDLQKLKANEGYCLKVTVDGAQYATIGKTPEDAIKRFEGVATTIRMLVPVDVAFITRP